MVPAPLSAVGESLLGLHPPAVAVDVSSWWENNDQRIITIVVTLAAALIVTWIVRRAIRHLVERIVRAGEERQRAAEAALGGLPDERETPTPGERAARRAAAGPPRTKAGPLSVLPPPGERIGQRARTLGSVLRNAATIVIWVIAGLIILGEFDVDLAPLLAGAGVAGVALGFGAQYIVRDLLSGIFILMEDQYGVGDVVDLGEATGVVEEVSLRVTRLRDVRGTVWYVPNGQIARVGNQSQFWARVILDIGVAYDTDVEAASRLIKRVADEVWHAGHDDAHVLEEPSIWGIEELGADSVVIRLAVKTRPGEQWAVARHIRAGVKTAFDEAGIVIPFPQRTIWVHPGGAALDASTPEPPPAAATDAGPPPR